MFILLFEINVYIEACMIDYTFWSSDSSNIVMVK